MKGSYSTVIPRLLEISVDAMQVQDLLSLRTSFGPVEKVKMDSTSKLWALGYFKKFESPSLGLCFLCLVVKAI